MASAAAGHDQAEKIVVHQPQFLPWAGYWHKVISADVMVMYAGVQFDRSDHMHRVQLAGSWLTWPVLREDWHKPIKEVRMSPDVSGLDIANMIRSRLILHKCQFPDRLDPLFNVLHRRFQPKFYLDMAIDLTFVLARMLEIKPELHIDVQERDSFDRVSKLDRTIADHSRKPGPVYLAGAFGWFEAKQLKVPQVAWMQLVSPDLDPESVVKLIAQDPDPLGKIQRCAVWQDAEGKQYDWRGVGVEEQICL